MTSEKTTKPIHLRPILCAAAVNRFSSCSVLFKINGTILVAFGAAQQIAIWECQDQDRYPPLELLKGHQAVVGVIKKLDNEDDPSLGFVSGDMDGRVLVWRREGIRTGQQSVGQWKIVAHLTGLQRSISCLSSIRLPPNHSPQASGDLDEYLVVAGASDGCLINWKVSIIHTSGVLKAIKVLQRLELGNQIALDAALAFLPNSTDLLLALATTDAKVVIYSSCLASLSFALGFRLPGHTDWIRSLDFIRDPAQTNELLLATGSQDNFVRIWRCREHVPMNVLDIVQPNPDTVACSETEEAFRTLDELTQNLKQEGELVDSDGLNLGSGQQIVEMKRYPIKNLNWAFASEALLYGHEGWVTNVHWCITPSGMLQLLSTSSDRSMIMWRPSETFDGVWINIERFGELGATTNLGFFGAHYFVCPLSLSETVLASGWTGAWHRWTRQDGALWAPCIAPTGHYRAVTALEWDREAEYLLSSSSDQTTRLWGCWRRPVEGQDSMTFESWHEICRPQVHGHDLYGVSFISDRRTRFVSISEEKVMRAFDMTEDFVKVAKQLCLVNLPFQEGSGQRVQRATIPPLGLSNRVKENEDHQDGKDLEETRQLCPPFEDQLLTLTLWPEIDKIYGHPSELSAIATSHSGQIIVSACHANSAQTASIRLHSTEDGFPAIPFSPLEAHQLTITRLAFNADDSKLVSVSRDRSWTVWHQPSKDGNFSLEQRMEKAHARVVWDTCWAPAHMNMFVSGSRDKTTKVWSKEGENCMWGLAETIKFEQPVKSCAVCSYPLPSQKMVLAIGLEDGVIALYASMTARGWECVAALELTSLCHAGPVNRLCFAPKPGQPEQGKQSAKVRLASGGEDGAVKVTELDLYSHCCP